METIIDTSAQEAQPRRQLMQRVEVEDEFSAENPNPLEILTSYNGDYGREGVSVEEAIIRGEIDQDQALAVAMQLQSLQDDIEALVAEAGHKIISQEELEEMEANPKNEEEKSDSANEGGQEEE